ncbi:flagellar assembly protein FliH [Rossellomorea aquimaris]|uniref:flagellar assembly protein FliH n=1 Tax=Rossellomorea aquimaris TaxID=189382 RepID=UPI0007D074A5|nr:flagellar assembly protein FliH [Rossellomorea aquimaris]
MSRIIKSSITQTSERKGKLISLKQVSSKHSNLPEEEGKEPMENSVELNRLLEEAEQKAANLVDDAAIQLKKAQEQIELERERWVIEREQLMQEAYNAGFQQGEQEGKRKGYQDYSAHLQQANDITEVNKQQYYSYIENAEKVILSLGVACAEKIINQKIVDEPENFISIIKRSLKEVRDLPEIQIHVHPSRHQLLNENKDELEVVFPSNVQCYIYANDELGRDECYIETSQGRIMVSVDIQLKELKQKLLEILLGDEE